MEENLMKVEQAIDSPNNGEMLNKKGAFVDNKAVVNVKGVGPARAILFPSLCCFTGLGTSTHAILTAKQVILNSETEHGCTGDKLDKPSELGIKLKVDGDSLPCNNSHCHSILEAAGMSIREVQSTMENASCAMTRILKHWDMFIKGQTLHCLFLDKDALNTHGGCEKDKSKVRSTVYEKRFGEETWTEKGQNRANSE